MDKSTLSRPIFVGFAFNINEADISGQILCGYTDTHVFVVCVSKFI